MSRKVVIPFLTLIALIVLLVAVARPVGIPVTTERVNGYLHAKYPLYDIAFESGRLTWIPGRRNVVLVLQRLALTDIGGDQVATVPRVSVEMDLWSVLRGAPEAQYLLLHEPRVRLERTLGGSFKIDLGETNEGLLGSIAQTLLIDLASAARNDERRGPVPQFRIEGGRLMLVDERSGGRFEFAPVSLALDSVAGGVRAEAALQARTFGEILELGLTATFQTRDRSIRVDGAFGNVNPAILSELLPGLRILSPIEIALRGSVTAVFGRDLSLRKVDMSIEGASGSLEVAQHTGSNIAIENMRADLGYDRESGVLQLTDISMNLGGRRLFGQLSTSSFATDYRVLGGDLTLSNASWDDLLPTWFAALGRYVSVPDPNLATTHITQRLQFEASLNRQDDRLRGGGTLDFGLLHLGYTRRSARPDVTLPDDLLVFIGGFLSGPEIAFRPVQREGE